MILVDTSVWIDHPRDGNSHLTELLNNGEVLCHPFIVGEISCGNLKNRNTILSLLHFLPQSSTIDHGEVMQFLENYRLMGRGIGWIDMHLLASSLLGESRLWTQDKKLKLIASELNIDYR